MSKFHQMIVISAPSGAGKTTICNRLVKQNKNFILSISATTRPPRTTEKHGVDYFFITEDEFWKKVRNQEFLEYESVHGYYYGTLKSQVSSLLEKGFYVIFDIDVNGALTIKKKYPKSILVFLKPPSMEELRKRLIKRKSDSKDEIEKRLRRLPQEYEKAEYFDYIVINDELSKTVEKIEKIIINN
jgi:guanylate kinase